MPSLQAHNPEVAGSNRDRGLAPVRVGAAGSVLEPSLEAGEIARDVALHHAPEQWRPEPEEAAGIPARPDTDACPLGYILELVANVHRERARDRHRNETVGLECSDLVLVRELAAEETCDTLDGGADS